MIEYMLSWMIMAAINKAGGSTEHPDAFRVAVRHMMDTEDPSGWVDAIGEWS